MKFNTILPLLALVGNLSLVQFASAQGTAPSIQSVFVECTRVDGQHHTVRLVMGYNHAPFDIYRYSFKNSITGQISTFFYFGRVIPQPYAVTFPLPQGVYNLTVAVQDDEQVNSSPRPGVAQALYNGVNVPPSYSTPNGRGTGCTFVAPVNVAPANAPARAASRAKAR